MPDNTEFVSLFERHSSRVFSVILRMLGNHQDAEDATQETFLRAYRALDDFERRSTEFTWLYRIAVNVCQTIQGRGRAAPDFASLEELIRNASEATPAFDKDLDRTMVLAQIREGCLAGVVRCLSFEQRAAFVLHVIAGLPIRDVANVVERSEGATKVLIHRARAVLRDFLCKLCSCYEPTNPCRCENLVAFSLRKGWVHLPSDLERQHFAAVDIDAVQRELDSLRRVVALIATLPEAVPTKALLEHLRNLDQTNV